MSTALWDLTHDYIILNGKRSPGLATVEGAKATYTYKINSGPYTTGSRMIFAKQELSKFTVKLQLFTREDLIDLFEWRLLIDEIPNPQKPANPLPIHHPHLAILAIYHCVVLEVSQLEPDGTGGWYLTIQFIEWRDTPQPSQAKVEKAKPALPVDPVDKEITDQQKVIEDLSQKNAKL
jgi:hypothetical protein